MPLLFVVKVADLIQQISQCYLQIKYTEEKYHISVSEQPVINVK